MDRREDDPDAGKPASGNPAAPGQLPDQAPDRAPGQLPAPNAAGLAFARAANTAAQATARSASTGEVPVTTSGSASDLGSDLAGHAVTGPGAATGSQPPVREPLTRVPVDLSLRQLDPAIDWCRHEVRRIVAWHLVATVALTLAIVVPVLWWLFGSAGSAIALGLVAAAVVVAVRVGIVLMVGPLGVAYVKAYTAAPPEYLLAHGRAPAALPPPTGSPAQVDIDLWDLDPNEVPDDDSDVGLDERFREEIGEPMAAVHAPDGAPLDPSDHADHSEHADLSDLSDLGDQGEGDPAPERRAAIADVLREMGFSPAAVVRADGRSGGRSGGVVDLFTDGDRIVAAIDRGSCSVTVLTELAGFRVLVTSALLVPPTDELVVNVVDDADPAGLVLSHQRLVQQAFRARTRVSEPVGLFKLAQQRELEAYRELGPFWGAMLDLRCRPRGARLAAAPAAGDVLLFTGNRLFQQTE